MTQKVEWYRGVNGRVVGGDGFARLVLTMSVDEFNKAFQLDETSHKTNLVTVSYCLPPSLVEELKTELNTTTPAVAREPEATRIARKAIEDYIAGLRDSHGEPTSDRAEVQIAAGEPLLSEKLGRAKSTSPPTCATCGGSGRNPEADLRLAQALVGVRVSGPKPPIPCPACADWLEEA